MDYGRSFPRTAPHVWAPTQSPVRIHYAPEVLRVLRTSPPSPDKIGVLFGSINGADMRVAASLLLNGKDESGLERALAEPTVAGLTPLGPFVSRVRGEVFLTEEDLPLFDRFPQPNAIALVIAGDKAGFFVRQPDSSLQSIRSYHEFTLTTPHLIPRPQAPAPAVRQPTVIPIFGIAGLAALVLTLAAVPLAARPFRHVDVPLDLELRERDGQILISWNREASVAGSATLEVRDGQERRNIAIQRGQATVTVERRSGDVEVILTVKGKSPEPRAESIRFLAPALAAKR